MKTITHDGITYRLTSEQYGVVKSRYDFMCKCGVSLKDANHAATVLTLEQFFSEFERSESDREVINLVSFALAAELLI